MKKPWTYTLIGTLVLIILVFRFWNSPKNNNYEENHPFLNADEYLIDFENKFDYSGSVKLNTDGILLIISKPSHSNIDSIKIKLDNIPLSNKEIRLMCLLNEDQRPIHCSTGTNFISRKSEEIYSTEKLLFSYDLRKGSDISNIEKIDLILFNNERSENASIIIY